MIAKGKDDFSAFDIAQKTFFIAFVPFFVLVSLAFTLLFPNYRSSYAIGSFFLRAFLIS